MPVPSNGEIIMKNVTLPTFNPDYSQIDRTNAQVAAVGQGLLIYQALASLKNGDVTIDDKGKGSGFRPTCLARGAGWNAGTLHKGVTVVHVMIPNWATMSNSQLTEATINIIAEHGSMTAAFHSIKPKAEPKPRAAKTVAELFGAGAREAEAQEMSKDEAIALAMAAIDSVYGQGE
jgi:hypothetical protein